MKHHNFAGHLATLLLFAGYAAAAELVDSKFGFRIDIPDDFFKLEGEASGPDTLYKFVDREPTPADPAHVIQIQRLRGVISPTARMDEKDIAIIDGIKTTLQEFNWNGYERDVLRQIIPLPTGGEYVVFGIQYPLSGEAVQLQVGGPIQDEEEIYSKFSQVAGTFQASKLLHSNGSLSIRTLSPGERAQKLVKGFAQLAVTLVVIVFLFRLAKRAFSKRKTNG